MIDNEKVMRKTFHNWCVESDLFACNDLVNGIDGLYQYADIDSAWLAWQQQQKKIDELKKGLTEIICTCDQLRGDYEFSPYNYKTDRLKERAELALISISPHHMRSKG